MPYPPSGAVKPNKTLLANPTGKPVVGVKGIVPAPKAVATPSMPGTVQQAPAKAAHLKNWVRQ